MGGMLLGGAPPLGSSFIVRKDSEVRGRYLYNKSGLEKTNFVNNNRCRDPGSSMSAHSALTPRSSLSRLILYRPLPISVQRYVGNGMVDIASIDR